MNTRTGRPPATQHARPPPATPGCRSGELRLLCKRLLFLPPGPGNPRRNRTAESRRTGPGDAPGKNRKTPPAGDRLTRPPYQTAYYQSPNLVMHPGNTQTMNTAPCEMPFTSRPGTSGRAGPYRSRARAVPGSSHTSPGHIPRTGRTPQRPHVRALRAAFPSRSPPACPDGLAARRLRVPDLTPTPWRAMAEVRNTPSLLLDQQEGGPIRKRTGGKPGIPPAPEKYGPVPCFPPDPHSCLPGTTESHRVNKRERCKHRGGYPGNPPKPGFPRFPAPLSGPFPPAQERAAHATADSDTAPARPGNRRRGADTPVPHPAARRGNDPRPATRRPARHDCGGLIPRG